MYVYCVYDIMGLGNRGVIIIKFRDRKDILLVITYVAIIVFGLVNFDKILMILSYIFKVFSPFIIGTILALILNVLINFIEKKVFGNIKESKTWNKIKRPLSICMSLVLVFLVVFFVMNLLIPQLKNSASLFTDTLPEYKEDVIKIMNRFDMEESSIDTVSDYLDNFGKVITDYIKGNSKDVISLTTEFASSIFAVISKGIIAIVFAIYIIAQTETLKGQVNKIMEAYLKPKTVDKIHEIVSIGYKGFASFITGQCFEALIIGSLCFVGMLILRLPYASTVSVVIGFTALIPVFGAFIGTAIGAFLILMVSPIKALIFIIFIIIAQQIDNNFIYPKVVGKSIGLPGMWVLLSVTVGATVGGILGMLIATPLCSLIYTLFGKEVNDRLKKNKIAIKVDKKEKA